MCRPILTCRCVSKQTFRAPQISTTSASCTTVTRKWSVCMSSLSNAPSAWPLQPYKRYTQTHILNQTQSDRSNAFTSLSINLTDGGLTEFLIRHLVGDICSHQHAHLDAQLLMNNLWDELQSVWSFIHPLNEPTYTVMVSDSLVISESNFPLFFSCWVRD